MIEALVLTEVSSTSPFVAYMQKDTDEEEPSDHKREAAESHNRLRCSRIVLNRPSCLE